MADPTHTETISHRVLVTVIGEVDLYEYDDMDRGEVTEEGLDAWKRLCRADIEDSLVGTLDSVLRVDFSPQTDGGGS